MESSEQEPTTAVSSFMRIFASFKSITWFSSVASVCWLHFLVSNAACGRVKNTATSSPEPSILLSATSRAVAVHSQQRNERREKARRIVLFRVSSRSAFKPFQSSEDSSENSSHHTPALGPVKQEPAMNGGNLVQGEYEFFYIHIGPFLFMSRRIGVS
jgi:hypothetical protein